jgi:hypothetical protein
MILRHISAKRGVESRLVSKSFEQEMGWNFNHKKILKKNLYVKD